MGASSPQGRFEEGAARLDGSTFEDAEAYGKHLLYRFHSAPSLHVHLGMAGRIILGKASEVSMIPAARLRLEARNCVLYLIAPARCELYSLEQRAQLLARLGPDPLRPDADRRRAFARISSSEQPIGSLLLDQSVIAGIGNVLRAEVLFLVGVHPERPGASFTLEELERLWETTVRVMTEARDRGGIITRVPPDVSEQDIQAVDEQHGRFVYRQQRCGRCATPVRSWTLAGRVAYACPVCQAA